MNRPRPVHVERTADPLVLRWVVHTPALAARPAGPRRPPDTSPLGRMLARGELRSVSIRSGDVFVGVEDAARWSTLATAVHDAVVDELDQLDTVGDGDEHWLTGAAFECDEREPLTVAEVQRIVDRVAGSTIADHGGSMIVVDVDATRVVIQAAGACDGCARSDATLLDAVRPAIVDADPRIVDVVLWSAGGGHGSHVAHTASPQAAPRGRRTTWRRSTGGRCH